MEGENQRKGPGVSVTYVPEELAYAAGILPVRILGGHEPPYLADPHISGQFCILCRDCLAEGLKGRYGYLDRVAQTIGSFGWVSIGDSLVLVVNGGFIGANFCYVTVEKKDSEVKFLGHNR